MGHTGRPTVHVQQTECHQFGVQGDPAEPGRDRGEPRRLGHARISSVPSTYIISYIHIFITRERLINTYKKCPGQN